MLYFVYSADKPESASIRQSNRQAHLQYMALHNDHIVLGGPTMAEDYATAEGTMLVVNFPSTASVHEFLDGDPYHLAGIFASRTVRHWKPVRFVPNEIEKQLNRRAD